MNTPPPSPQKLRRWLVIVALIMAALLVPLSILVVLQQLSPGNSNVVQARIDALKKAGYPVSADDLAKLYPPLPDDQNSVIIYQKAFSEYVRPPENSTNWPRLYTIALLGYNPPHEDWSKPIRPDIRQGISNYLTQNRGALDLLHQAAAIQKGHYDHGFSNELSHVTDAPFVQLSDNADLLGLAVIMYGEAGRPDLAAQSILDSLGISRSLEHDPWLNSQMIREGYLGLSCSSLEQALNKNSFTDDELRSLFVPFQQAELYDGIQLAVIADRCDGIVDHDRINRMDFLHRKDLSLLKKLNVLIHYTKEHPENGYLFYIDMMGKYAAAADAPYPKRLEVVKQLDLQAQADEKSQSGFGASLLYGWHDRFEIDAKIHAQLLASLTAIAIERYRRANADRLPRALGELTPTYLPSVPADPFDGKPLRYNLLPKGYLIYSIGPDGVDNGGREWDNEKQSGDLTFTVER